MEFKNSKGKYKTRIGGIKTPACRLWENMGWRLERYRTYNPDSPAYDNVVCCDEWYEYQTFAEWYDKMSNTRYFDRSWHLDKDVLCWGRNTKTYSPNTCVFLPKDVNNILVNKRAFRGNLPLGVTHSGSGKYDARVYRGKEAQMRLYTDDVEEAFAFYKKHKEEYVRRFVNTYPAELDPRVYIFFNDIWEVNIDD